MPVLVRPVLVRRPSTFVTRRSVRRPFDPFAEFDSLVRAAFGPNAVRPASAFSPAAEVNREGDDALVRLEIPGIDIERDLVVEVQDGRLVIRGERRDEHASEEDGRRVREVRYGSFRRSFALPEHVTAEAVTATYDAGVLSVRIAGAYTAPAAIESQPVAVPVGTASLEAGTEAAAESGSAETPAAETPAAETPAAG